MSMSPRRRAAAALLLGAALLLCGSALMAQSTRTLGEVLQSAEGQAPAAVLALNASTLSAQITAVVVEIAADVGDTVSAGSVLVKLDDTDYQLALRRAQAQQQAASARLDLARQRLARARELSSSGFASADELLSRSTEEVSAQAELRNAQLAVDAARTDLSRCRIVAPFDGVVRLRMAQLGQLATPGSALLELVSSTDVEVRAKVQAVDAASLVSGSALRFEGIGGSHGLNLVTISPLVDAGSRTREARLRFAGPPQAAGSEGRLLWQRSQGLLPAEWLLRRNGQLGIFVVEDGQARFMALPAAQEGRPALVDLPPGTLLAADGRDGLQDGDRVQP